MTYITIKRTRINSLSGTINLPYGTEIDCVDGVLLHNGAPICADHSQNAYDFFARNDDGEGLRRGELTQGIREALAKTKPTVRTDGTRYGKIPFVGSTSEQTMPTSGSGTMIFTMLIFPTSYTLRSWSG